MINSQHRRIATAAAILALAAGSATVAAAARPLDPDPAPPRSSAFPDSPLNCPLRRIDRQLVRCDNLTGAGVTAPPFIPELATIVQVRGRQLPVDDQGSYWTSGNLIGRWTLFTAETLPGYAIPEAPWTLVQTGQERFDGCIDQNHSEHCDSSDPLGALNFEYLMWVRYEPNTGRLIEGNCVHPITSGTQDFAGARGVLTMHDIPVGRGVEARTKYQGKIVLNAVPNERVVPQNHDVSAVSGARTAGC